MTDSVRSGSDKPSDEIISAGMLADRLRPIVLGGEGSCLKGGPFIPLHRATVSSIYLHLERLADRDGELTLLALERALAKADDHHEQQRKKIALAIEARKLSGTRRD